ncbi:hypothetical protein BDR04DRAFT_1159196 [Suillus decipiens]|nr:hypothetical protein BDR04DRAFT_1159196 [Suillus decipiens]
MQLMGQLEHGLYSDDCEGVHPDIIRQYYGTTGQPILHASHQTGAGHASDEEYSDSDDASNTGESDNRTSSNEDSADKSDTDSEFNTGKSEEGWEDIQDNENLQEIPQLIAAEHSAYFHDRPIHVPKHTSPFSPTILHNTFCPALAQVRDAGHIPTGYELLGTNPARPSSTAYKKANSEANQGLKSTSHSYSLRPKAGKKKAVSGHCDQIKVGAILVISCGTKQAKRSLHSYIPLLTPILHNPQMPTVADIQTLEIVGLAITDHVAGISINKNWSFSLLDLELRKHFPQLFIYLDALPKTPNPDYDEHQEDIYCYLPPYYLCVKEK